MPDKHSKFHEFSLKSILFKGRAEWYYCYLKTERLAHALFLLADMSDPLHRDSVYILAERAASLPGEFAHLAAGEIDAPVVLADVYSLLSGIRSLAAGNSIAKENAAVLQVELEHVAERLVAGSHPSPFLSSEDFSVPALPSQTPATLSLRSSESYGVPKAIKDISKGHKGQNERMSLILDFVRKQKSASIKDIARTIKGCSEKTIQRELTALIRQGLIRKVGERRWSVYVPS
jgi:hypothetical protein